MTGTEKLTARIQSALWLCFVCYDIAAHDVAHHATIWLFVFHLLFGIFSPCFYDDVNGDTHRGFSATARFLSHGLAVFTVACYFSSLLIKPTMETDLWEIGWPEYDIRSYGWIIWLRSYFYHVMPAVSAVSNKHEFQLSNADGAATSRCDMWLIVFAGGIYFAVFTALGYIAREASSGGDSRAGPPYELYCNYDGDCPLSESWYSVYSCISSLVATVLVAAHLICVADTGRSKVPKALLQCV